MCLPPARGGGDICVALTPWKQLRVVLSTEHRARLSPTTAGIYKRQETPCQSWETGEICDRWNEQGWVLVLPATESQGLGVWDWMKCPHPSRQEMCGFCATSEWGQWMNTWEEVGPGGRETEKSLAIGAVRGQLPSFHFLWSQGCYFHLALPSFTCELHDTAIL